MDWNNNGWLARTLKIPSRHARTNQTKRLLNAAAAAAAAAATSYYYHFSPVMPMETPKPRPPLPAE